MAEKKEISHLRVLSWVLGVSFLLMIIKFAAWYITNSNAILSDALESIINVLTGLMALYSIHLSSKPRDRDHPYGHGKIEFISSGIEGVLVLGAGVGICFQAFTHLLHPQTLERLEIGIWLIALTTAVNFIMGSLLIRLGKGSFSPTIEANGRHLRVDALTSVAILIGLGLTLLTGKTWLDNAFSLLFGLFILREGYLIIRKSIGGIMDETDFEVVKSLLELINTDRKDSWIDIHNLRVIKYGRVLHIDCHLTLPWYFDLRASHEEMEEIDRLAHQLPHEGVELFVHVDPCLPPSCRICSIQNCQVRQKPFEEKLNWTLDNLLPDSRHE